MTEFAEKLSEELSYPANSFSAPNRADRAYINPWNLVVTLKNKGYARAEDVHADDDLEYDFGQRIKDGDEVEFPVLDPSSNEEYILRILREDDFVEVEVSGPVDEEFRFEYDPEEEGWETIYTEVLEG